MGNEKWIVPTFDRAHQSETRGGWGYLIRLGTSVFRYKFEVSRVEPLAKSANSEQNESKMEKLMQN